MKKLLFALTAVAMVAVSCKDIQETDFMKITQLTLTATTEQPVGTRTMVAGAGEVFWEKGDEIKVFAGTASGRFVSDVESGIASTAIFTGSLGGAWTAGSPLWAVYPFSDEAVLEGETLTAELPAVQTARSMSFAQNMNLSVARTTTASLQFYNVGGGVCFTLMEGGIQKVVFEGLNGEILAGKVKIAFQEDRPVVQEVVEGSTTVTLEAPEGKTLEGDGVWYYIVALPGTLEKGFKLSFYKGDAVAQKTFAKTVTVKRSIYGEVRNADEGVSYIPDTDENIAFKDAKVKSIVVRYFDTGKDGELSFKEAAAVRSFFVDEALTRADGDQVSVFAGTDIETFDEIVYFTGLTKIEDGAFAGCTQLTSITIPANITEIGANAFKGCTGLQSITILSETPPTIGEGAFADTNDCPIIVPAGTTETYVAAWGEYAPRIEGGQPDNEIWYTSTDGNIVLPNDTGVFGANFLSNEYNDGKGVLKFDGPVTMVGELAFLNCETLREAILPKTVTTIGGGAFYNNTGLESVHIPELVSDIGIQAFMRATNITKITVDPGNVTYDSRENCNAIIHTATNTLISGCQNSFIPNDVKLIGDYAFVECRGLIEITIPESVDSIGISAFNYCEGLTSLSIPSSVTSLGAYAFNGCKSLSSIILYHETPPEIGRSCFRNGSTCPIYVPTGSVESYKAAESWSDYVKRILPMDPEARLNREISYTSTDGGKVTPSYAQYNIPAETAFGGALVVYNSYTDGKGKIIFDSDVTELVNSFQGCTNLHTITLPPSVAYIGGYSFAGCENLTGTIKIPEGQTTINNAVFQGCTSLTGVDIPEGVTYVGSRVFSGCTSLTELTFPKSLTSISYNAAYGCSGLKRITVLAETPPRGGTNLFTGSECPIYVPAASVEAYKAAQYWSEYADRIQALEPEPQPDNEIWYTTTDGQIIEEPGYARLGQKEIRTFGANLLSHEYVGGKGVMTFDGPVTMLGPYAFDGNTTLQTISYPKTVTSIQKRCFNYCPNLSSIEIPEQQTVIEAGTFSSCHSLVNIVLPSALTTIGDQAFVACTGLKAITIPAGVTSIGAAAFTYCSNLSEIVVSQDNPVYDSRGNCNAIIETATNTLRWGSTTIPASVTKIGTMAFAQRSHLKEIAIPEMVTEIGVGAFSECSELETITIPAHVTVLGKQAFYDCPQLKEVIVLAETPPSCGEKVFDNPEQSGVAVYPIDVPAESVEAYKTAEGWNAYADRIQADLTEMKTELDNELKECEKMAVYCLDRLQQLPASEQKTRLTEQLGYLMSMLHKVAQDLSAATTQEQLTSIRGDIMEMRQQLAMLDDQIRQLE